MSVLLTRIAGALNNLPAGRRIDRAETTGTRLFNLFNSARMKRTTYFFLSLLLAVGGCSTDLLDIEESNAVVDNTSGTGNAGDTSSDVKTPESDDSATDSATSVTDDAEDNITGTDFDRTIAIVFGGTQATVTGDEHSIVTVSGNDGTQGNVRRAISDAGYKVM